MSTLLPARTAGLIRRAAPPALLPAVPGLLMALAVAAAAFGLREVPGLGIFSPLILAILLGMVWRNLVGTPAAARPGLALAMRPLLRTAIVLLGLQLTIGQVLAIGGPGLGVVAGSLAATLLLTLWLGRLLKVSPELTALIAAGSSICGASAVIAVNSVTGAEDEDVAYAIACVTLFGTLCLFLYPLLPAVLPLSPTGYGVWIGSSVHEVAQVVAAGFQQGQAAGETATIAKLARVMLLAPVVLTLGWVTVRRRADESGTPRRTGFPLPWFVVGFLAMIALNSVISLDEGVRSLFSQATAFLLTVALAAMGLETSLRRMHGKGLRPLLLAATAWLFIGGFSLTLVLVLL